MHRKKINVSTVLAGQKLGIKEVEDGIWLDQLHAAMIWDTSTWSRKHYRQSTTRSAANVVTHVSGTNCYLCLRIGHGMAGAGEGNRTLVVSLGSCCSTIELHPRTERYLSRFLRWRKRAGHAAGARARKRLEGGP
jgi:hypothetical protein